MKTPRQMSNRQLKAWAIKTTHSISAHAARGNTINNSRSYDLIDRYTDIKEEMQERRIWEEYCDEYGWSISHDAYDSFA